MPTLKSRIKTDSGDFAKNDAANRKLANELRELVEKISLGGSDRARDKHLSRGKLLPRTEFVPSSIAAHRSSKSASLRRMAYTMMTSLQRESSRE